MREGACLRTSRLARCSRVPSAAPHGAVLRRAKAKCERTLHLERRPLEPSIQTYSAITMPFWGSARYFWSWMTNQQPIRKITRAQRLTFAVFETMVERACETISCCYLLSPIAQQFVTMASVLCVGVAACCVNVLGLRLLLLQSDCSKEERGK